MASPVRSPLATNAPCTPVYLLDTFRPARFLLANGQLEQNAGNAQKHKVNYTSYIQNASEIHSKNDGIIFI